MRYNWQQKDWPNFKYSTDEVEQYLYAFSERAGRLSGVMEVLPEELQFESIVDLLVAEALKTSEIEGEYLSRKDVMSSIRNNLGLNTQKEPVNDKRARGVAQMMVDAQKFFDKPLSQKVLFSWHTMLMKGNSGIQAGCWREHTEPMQVISGAMGREIVHYEAPPSSRVPEEMENFISWFNSTAPGAKDEIKKPVIRAAIAHLYFESIHPFQDGNGRIGRAISEKALSQYLHRPVLLSLSQAIEAKKKDYYAALKTAQRSNEITAWIKYFVKTTLEAQEDAEGLINFSVKKAKFFDKFKDKLNERQLKTVKRMLEEGYKGFEGGMNARKYISLNKTSKSTATRDLQDLLDMGAFTKKGGGRSTSYELNL
ncbi:MAG: Fic family protein [Candidatus Bathyarchaeota archaeon]|nr:Fic family protein [Candidatus Bathyarchaeota archaeon]